VLLERDMPVDWKALLLDFIRRGWTLKGVAEALNVAPTTVMGWWNEGNEPMYENGRALVKLHAAEFKKRNGDPRIDSREVQTTR